MIISVDDYDNWRELARALLAEGRQPNDVRFHDRDDQGLLFEQLAVDINNHGNRPFSVPRGFLWLAEQVALHRDAVRWDLLYRVLWRLQHGESHLLQIDTDDDVYRLTQMKKQVRRDAHKMKAFVRFRKLVEKGQEHFIAWHRPDHRILRKVAPFFARRFKAMHWTILTPDASVVWDQCELRFHAGVPRNAAPAFDELEDLWRTYYRSIFNPARVKVKMMKSEMPVRHWPTLPEAQLIPDLLVDAAARSAELKSRR